MGVLASAAGDHEVTVAGLTFQVPHAPAARWLGVLLDPECDWLMMLAWLLPAGDGDRLVDAALSSDLSIDDATAASKALLTEVAGRPWWEAVNIVSVADVSWDAIGGDMVLRGVDPGRVTLGAWIEAAWWLLRKAAGSAGKQELATLVSQVTAVPSEEMGDGSMSEDAFMAAATQSLIR